MSLSLVATPIGHPDDITLRALQALREAEVIIVEEFRPLTTLLKHLEIPKPQLEQLNEHSSEEDLRRLVNICREKRTTLVSDCGTPGFCDPGADLVRLCRQGGISVTSLPGASSLMLLLSMAGAQVKEFVFRGFPPAKKEARQQALAEIAREPRAQILMDTPYRLGKLLSELNQLCPSRFATIGVNLTQSDEKYLESDISHLSRQLSSQKAEFIMFLHETAK